MRTADTEHGQVELKLVSCFVVYIIIKVLVLLLELRIRSLLTIIIIIIIIYHCIVGQALSLAQVDTNTRQWLYFNAIGLAHRAERLLAAEVDHRSSIIFIGHKYNITI